MANEINIVIRHIGPIKEANLNLNKVNVFMGPQSSGKSTIAKLISYCTWVEKDVATSQSLEMYQQDDNYFINLLASFHKIDGYFKHPDRRFLYKSDIIEIEYDANNFTIKWRDQYAYKRSKVSYIPSERNMVILPEVEKVEFGYCNIRSFLFDWFDFRKNYLKTKEMPILNLGMNYYYDEGSRENRVVKFQNGRSYDILLSNASSGLQSVAPLLAFIDYLTDGFYAQEEDISPLLNERKTQTDRRLIEELILKKYFNNNRKDNIRDEINEIKEKIKTGDDHLKRLLRRLGEVEENLFSTHNTQFIIEEPEQNLFPDTQRDLVYHLLDKCLDDERNHRLTITTHSPYILYALNNCMMGGLIGDKMKDADKGKVKCRTSCIDPSLVSIHEIHDGILKSIQQDDGLIGKNYFDVKMKELMDDFYVMLNYYGA